VRSDNPAAPADASTPETPEPPPEAVPALEPRESTAQEAAQRQQIQRLQEDVRQRLARLNEARLSPSERKTLEDARTFFAQSTRAIESGDLQRALNLARKASLLVAALE
jgi:RNA polymerase-interacting CarD/CdnL/TRCF family regulator